MSWDGLMCKFPTNNIDDIGNDWRPQKIGTKEEVLNAIKKEYQNGEFSENQVNILTDTTWVELNFYEDPVSSISIRTNAGHDTIKILKRLCMIFDSRILDHQTGEIADFDAHTQNSIEEYAKLRDKARKS